MHHTLPWISRAMVRTGRTVISIRAVGLVCQLQTVRSGYINHLFFMIYHIRDYILRIEGRTTMLAVHSVILYCRCYGLTRKVFHIFQSSQPTELLKITRQGIS